MWQGFAVDWQYLKVGKVCPGYCCYCCCTQEYQLLEQVVCPGTGGTGGMCRIKNKILEPIQSYEGYPFLGPKWSISPEENFFRKTINIMFMCLWAPFIVQNFKKIPGVDPELWKCAILGPKQPIPLPDLRKFSKNPSIHLVLFIHAYLPSKNQSQMSIHYWNIHY